MRPLTFLLPFFLAVSTPSLAVDPPRVEIVRTDDGRVRVTLAEDTAPASGYDVYREGMLLESITLPDGASNFDVDGASGDYCVVAFVTVADVTRHSVCSVTFTVPPAATARAANTRRLGAGPPTPPPRFRGTVYSPGVAEVFWDPASDDGRVVAYRLERDGTEVMEGDGRSHFEPMLERDRIYRYAVVAIDNDGEESAPARITLDAGVVGETTLPPGGNEQPGPPGSVRGEFHSPGVAEIFWTVSPDHVQLAGYEIRRDGERIAFHKGRSQFEPELVPGRSYEYEIVAVDADDNRSEPARFVLEGDGTPPSGSLSIVATPASTSLLEGTPDGIDIALEIQRDTSALRPATLVLLPESPDDQAGLIHAFEPSVLGVDVSAATLTLRLPISMAPRLPHERRFRVRIDDGQSIGETLFAIDIEPTAADDVYLLIGQSNMEGFSEHDAKRAGAGQMDEPVERVKQPNVRANNPAIFSTLEHFTDEATNFATPRFITAEDPLHDQRWPGLERKSGTFIGPGLTFAKSALAHTTRTIFLVPAAWGATGFCANSMGDVAWNASAPSAPGLGGTWLVERALLRLNMTLRETGGVLRGILWHQGGADSNDPRCAETHESNLVALVRRLRSEARVDIRGPAARGEEAPIPFIVATQSMGSDERGDFSNFSTNKQLVDAVHRSIESLVPHAGFVDNDDLVPPTYPCGQSSCVHFGAKAYREQGRRFAEVLRRVSLESGVHQ